MLARVLSAALSGVEAVLVRVEVHVASGLPTFTMVRALERSNLTRFRRTEPSPL